MREKNYPNVYSTQEGKGEKKFKLQVYTTYKGLEEIKVTLRYTLPKRV